MEVLKKMTRYTKQHLLKTLIKKQRIANKVSKKIFKRFIFKNLLH